MKFIRALLTSVWVATTASSVAAVDDGNGPRPVGRMNRETQKNSREDGVFDIDMTGEAHYYDDFADNFELCNVKTEETCYYYDDTGSLTYYCAMLVDGGCKCTAGLKKCDAFPLTGAASFCAMVCCDETEEACYDYDDDGKLTTQYCASLADGGCPCPESQEKCDGDPLNGIPSYCDTICCDGGTEETCYDYDEDGKLNQYCAAYTDGGCPCPQGQEKCAADPLNGIASYCAIVCCDSIKEQICIDYDEDGYVNQYCAAIADGGCPCPDGETNCIDERNGGSSYCAQVCCDSLKEEPCYDYDDVGNVKQYCAALSDGGCPCPEGQKKCDADPWIGMTSYYCAMVCCNIITEETCSYYDKDGILGQYCALLADGGCRDTDSNEFIINHLHNYKSANTTIHGDSGTIAEYDEDEVAEILHAM